MPMKVHIRCVCVCFMMSALASMGTTLSVPVTAQTTDQPSPSSPAKHTHPVRGHETDFGVFQNVDQHLIISRVYLERYPARLP